MKWYNGDPDTLLRDWKLTENPFWADYQVLGALEGAYRVLSTMDDVLPIMVGAKGCSYHLRFTIVAGGETSFDLGKRLAAVLEFPVEQIVIGDLRAPQAWADRLKDLVAERPPRLLVLLPTDALVVSGTDLRPLARQVEALMGVPTTWAEASSITGQNPHAGYDAAMSALLAPYLEKPCPHRSGVNLLGWHWPSRQRIHEIGACVDMLERLDIEVKSILSGGSKLEDFERAVTAAGNAAVCPAVFGSYVDDMARRGVPVVAGRSPYGFSGTREWLEQICAGLGLDRGREIDALEAEYRPAFEANKRKLEGKKIFISGGPGRLIGLMHLMMDYGLEIEAAALFWPHERSREDLEHMLRHHGVKINQIIVSPSLYEIEEIARQYRLDLWAGGYQELHTCKRHHIPFVPITVYTVPHVGFEGAVNFGNKMLLALDGFSFTDNLFQAKEIEPCIAPNNDARA